MKIDLHCHSQASFDCITPLPRILARCRERSIVVQAITDHNEIWGAQKLRELAEAERVQDPDTPIVIVGEEVSTLEGEIVGLFLSERIPKGLSPEETVAQIKGQGGLVLIPHGFDPRKKHRLKPEALERIQDQVDIIEAFNARVSKRGWNEAAATWADRHHILKSAGSDAHTLADVGTAWVEAPMMEVTSPETLLEALRLGTVLGHWTHPMMAFAYKVWDWGYRVTKRQLLGRS